MKLKKIVFLILSLSFFFSSNAQNFSPAKTKKQIQILKAFEGEWIGVKNEVDTFKVVLKFMKNALMFKRKYTVHNALFGWHHYSKNGVVESSNLTKNLSDHKFSITNAFSINDSAINDDSIILGFDDCLRINGSSSVSFTINPHNRDEAIWRILFVAPPEERQIVTIVDSSYSSNSSRHKQNFRKNPPSELTQIPEWHMVRVKKQ